MINQTPDSAKVERLAQSMFEACIARRYGQPLPKQYEANATWPSTPEIAEEWRANARVAIVALAMLPAIEWISEGDRMPLIGQQVLLCSPRQFGEFWDVEVAWLAARHEGVVAAPIKAGGKWPTDYYWRRGGIRSGNHPDSVQLITGNAFWALTDGMNLPPGAEHQTINGYHVIAQIGDVFIPKGPR